MKDDNRSYLRNFCSCEKKAWKKIQGCTFRLLWEYFVLFQEPMAPDSLRLAFFGNLYDGSPSFNLPSRF